MKNGNGKGFKSTDDWNRIVNRVRDLVIETIERRTGARDLKAAIASERVNAPTTCKYPCKNVSIGKASADTCLLQGKNVSISKKVESLDC